MREYGYSADGSEIQAPEGWRVLCKGQIVPRVHRVYLEATGWTEERRTGVDSAGKCTRDWAVTKP